MPDAVVATAAPAPLHPISRRHLEVLSTELGILQQAPASPMDPRRGYRIDDVARALQVDVLHARSLGWSAVADSVRRNLQFIEDAFDESTGRFMALRSADGEWVREPGSNESLGRVQFALGETIAAAQDARIVDRALSLFARALKATGKLTSAPAQASVVLGCAAIVRSGVLAQSTEARDQALTRDVPILMRTFATGIHARFLDRARPGWPWPEDTLTGENALLPRALIVAGHRGNAESMLAIGLQVLDWLIDVQTAKAGHLSPIGSGGWSWNGERAKFDQRPIEATTLLLAAEAAYDATGNPRYRDAMERAYAWFLAKNDAGARIANPARGACATALTPRGVDRNETAESTLMWLVAAEHIRALRAAKPRVQVPLPPGRIARPAAPQMLGGSKLTPAPA